MNRHLRKAVVVTAAITAGLLMTACQSDSGTGDSKTTGTSQHKSASKNAKNSKNSKTSSQSSSRRSSGVAAENASAAKKGVSGAFNGGTVTYLAPGKYIVHVAGRTDQQFLTAEDTAVYGAGTVCGSPRSEARPRCTLDQLELAAEKGAVTADVTMKDGIATVVRERHDVENGTGSGGSGAKGVNGTWLGTVSYLAPGKYTVSDMKGVEQAFYVSDSTLVYGAGTICGSPRSYETPRCTLDQLEAAAKKGVSAKVEISGGIATSVSEDR